jgi:hypothetical protein
MEAIVHAQTADVARRTVYKGYEMQPASLEFEMVEETERAFLPLPGRRQTKDDSMVAEVEGAPREIEVDRMPPLFWERRQIR